MMNSFRGVVPLLLLLLSAIHSQGFERATSTSEDAMPYIIYLGGSSHSTFESAHEEHHNMLLTVFQETEKAEDAIIYHYRHGFNGFAASLTPTQAETLRKISEVLAIFPSRKQDLHTTRSWEYLGLNASDPQGLLAESGFGADVIVGILDTGIWPESPSFNDYGFPAPPARWKGECVPGVVPTENFTAFCNNKLIGARYYIKGYEANPARNASTDKKLVRSPRDTQGHGTHTASTVAGRGVRDASFYGLANGTASGGATRARVAVYKVCWTNGCEEVDMLAAFDDAIQDGVDVISISIGGGPIFEGYSYFGDSIAIGSLHAVLRGILVSASAGNDGPSPGTVTNVAPWLLTVAASTTDREFVSEMTLGDGSLPPVQGVAVNVYDTLHDLADNVSYPLVYGGDIPSNGSLPGYSSACVPGSLNATLAQGKIVLCHELDSDDSIYVPSYITNPDGSYTQYSVYEAVLAVGGLGVISIDQKFSDSSLYPFTWWESTYNLSMAATGVTSQVGDALRNYVLASSAPVAFIGDGVTAINAGKAPKVAIFSSRGPNPFTPNILKPDVSAPGVDILAAWTGAAGPLEDDETDTRRVQYNLLSGTSMACPHVTGVAALLKARHPTWSPAAIKSALMTTADPLVTDTHGVVNYGAGQINPVRAADPGLIFDITSKDYLLFFCAMPLVDGVNNYTSLRQLIKTEDNITCPTQRPLVADLNLPSIAISNFSSPSIIHRTVTNVGLPNSTYTWLVESPIPGAVVNVSPDTLDFKALGETKSFTVEIIPQRMELQEYGFLIWTDGTHKVRMPISLQSPTPLAPT